MQGLLKRFMQAAAHQEAEGFGGLVAVRGLAGDRGHLHLRSNRTSPYQVKNPEQGDAGVLESECTPLRAQVVIELKVGTEEEPSPKR